MKENRLYTALDVCIAAMDSGVSAEDCAALYPDLREELEPLLQASRLARSLSVEAPPYKNIQRSRAKLLSAASKLKSQKRRWRFPRLAFPRFALAALSLLVILLISFNGLIVASAQSLPGDTLYPVKLVAENVQLQFAPNTEIKHSLEDNYINRRAEEVHALLQAGRVAHIAFEGVVSEISPDRWIVDGIPVVPAGHVRVIGLIETGDVIEVEGTTVPSGYIEADELHLRYYNYTGTVVSKDSRQWQIGDVDFVVDHAAQIDPTLVEGDAVLVLVYSSDNGHLYARAILRDMSDPVKSSSQSSEIDFAGLLQAVGDGYAIIDGKTVAIDKQTVLENSPVPGNQVHVSVSIAPNGEMTALTISAPVENIEPSIQTPEIQEDRLSPEDSSNDIDTPSADDTYVEDDSDNDAQEKDDDGKEQDSSDQSDDKHDGDDDNDKKSNDDKQDDDHQDDDNHPDNDDDKKRDHHDYDKEGDDKEDENKD